MLVRIVYTIQSCEFVWLCLLKRWTNPRKLTPGDKEAPFLILLTCGLIGNTRGLRYSKFKYCKYLFDIKHLIAFFSSIVITNFLIVIIQLKCSFQLYLSQFLFKILWKFTQTPLNWLDNHGPFSTDSLKIQCRLSGGSILVQFPPKREYQWAVSMETGGRKLWTQIVLSDTICWYTENNVTRAWRDICSDCPIAFSFQY